MGVLEQLTQLNEKELAAVQARATFLLRGRGTDDSYERLIHDVIAKAFDAIGVRCLPYPMVKKRPLYKNLKAGTEVVVGLMRQFNPKGKAAERKALMLIVEALLDWQLDVVGLRAYVTTVRMLGKAGEALDSAYPGYAGSNLLPMLLQPETV